MNLLGALNVVGQTGRVHPRGNINRVAPNVVLRLSGADDARHNRAHVQADAEHKVVVGVDVNLVEAFSHLKDHLHKAGHTVGRVGGLTLWNSVLGNEANGGHKAAAHRFDLLNGTVLF